MSLPTYEEQQEVVQATDAPWCVDGRPGRWCRKGPQMLGGSLHPVVLRAIYQNTPLDASFVEQTFQQLTSGGYAIGVHRGSHHNPDKNESGCGFADNLPAIFQKISQKRDEISTRLMMLYDDNTAVFEELIGREVFEQSLTEAFEKFDMYTHENIDVSGDRLIQIAKEMNGQVVNLDGDHGEQVAFWNMKRGVTYDTNAQAEKKQQAFNLDYWAVAEQANVVEVTDAAFTLAASAILYVATEMVLVEDKGKQALSVVVHA